MPGFADYHPGGTLGRASVVVRAAAAADIAAISRIQSRAGRGPLHNAFERTLTDEDRCVVVAETTDADETTNAPVTVGWAQTYHHTVAQDLAPVGHYLGGVTVDPAWRRQGVGHALTQARIDWIVLRSDDAYYVVNPNNRASIDLHRAWAFREIAHSTRLTGVEFTGGVGLLMHADLREPSVSRNRREATGNHGSGPPAADPNSSQETTASAPVAKARR